MNSTQLSQVLSTGKYTLIDTREPIELKQGQIEGAINIPLRTIPTRVEEISKLERPIILFCRSGMRSGMATGVLRSVGIAEAYNGGSWYDVAQAFELIPVLQKKAGE